MRALTLLAATTALLAAYALVPTAEAPGVRDCPMYVFDTVMEYYRWLHEEYLDDLPPSPHGPDAGDIMAGMLYGYISLSAITSPRGPYYDPCIDGAITDIQECFCHVYQLKGAEECPTDMGPSAPTTPTTFLA